MQSLISGYQAHTRRTADRAVQDAILSAFDCIDNRGGHYNLVSLLTLRRTLPQLTRSAVDAALMQLRRNGVLSLSLAEGRQGLSADALAACVREGDTLLLYVSRRAR